MKNLTGKKQKPRVLHAGPFTMLFPKRKRRLTLHWLFVPEIYHLPSDFFQAANARVSGPQKRTVRTYEF